MTRQIIAADDSSVMLLLTSAIIESLGFQPLTARTGADALRILAESYKQVVLILLDWNMPEKNGLETLKEIRKSSRYAHIPVVMVTTESEGKSIVQAVQAGANHYVTKPFTQQQLAVAIKEALGMGDDGQAQGGAP
jgi:two-component system, chemotaxis family, chemotaxis protein CheY